MSAEFDRVTVERQLVPSLAERLHGRVGYDDAHTSVRILRKLEEALPEGAELVAAAGAGRAAAAAARTPARCEAIAEAAKLADEVYEWLGRAWAGGPDGARGGTGRGGANARAGRRARRSRRSSPPGENGALAPSRRRASVRSAPASWSCIDMGAMVDGYCSDCTRTFATGEPGGEEREVYELVRHGAGRRGWRRSGPGPSGARRRRRVPRDRSTRPATASTSATAWATASGSRSTRRPGWARRSEDDPRGGRRRHRRARRLPAGALRRADRGSGGRHSRWLHGPDPLRQGAAAARLVGA